MRAISPAGPEPRCPLCTEASPVPAPSTPRGEREEGNDLTKEEALSPSAHDSRMSLISAVGAQESVRHVMSCALSCHTMSLILCLANWLRAEESTGDGEENSASRLALLVSPRGRTRFLCLPALAPFPTQNPHRVLASASGPRAGAILVLLKPLYLQTGVSQAPFLHCGSHLLSVLSPSVCAVTSCLRHSLPE